MTENNPAATVDQLPAPIRAQQVLKFDQRKAELAELAKQSERIKEITNPAGYQECHAARMTLKNARLDIQRAGKEAREDATAFSKAVIAHEKTLVAIVEGEETRLQGIQDAWDAAREAERAEKARQAQEDARVLREKLDAIKARPLSVIGKAASTIAKLIEDTRALDVSDFPETHQAEAAKLRDEAVDRLVQIHTERVEADAAAQRLAAERAELERQRKAQEEAAAEQARIAREQREREEAEQRERLAQQQGELAAERERLAEVERQQQAAAAAERERLRQEEEERQRQAKAERERLDAERREFEQKQAEAARVERERQEAAEREAARQREEAERAELQRAIDSADLLTSARQAVGLLVAHGLGDHVITLSLAAALDREEAKRNSLQEAA